MSKETKKTSAEWIKEVGYEVLDPDGWDRANFDYSWNKEKITMAGINFINEMKGKELENKMTEEQIKWLGWKLVKQYNHDQYNTNRYKLGCMEIEFTYEGKELLTCDVTISELNCMPISFNQAKLLTELSNEAQNPLLRVGAVMPSCLRLSLKTQWFEMTKAGIKTEDYRELNEYWHKRLFTKESIEHMEDCHDNYGGCIHINYLDFKKFDYNIMTLGYPKNGDAERILKLEHKGIEIRTGNTEWGAEPNKLYFVIMHGAAIA